MPLPLAGIAIGLAAKFAPELIGKIAGKDAEKIASQVIGIATGVTGESDPEAAMAALEANTAMQHEFRMRAMALDAELEKAYLADRENARSRDIAIRQAGQRNWRADALALIVVAGVVLIATVLMFVDVPQANVPYLTYLFGMLNTALAAIIHFEFGSSRGSKNKEAIMASWE